MNNQNNGNKSRFSAPETRVQTSQERPPSPRRSFAQDPALAAEAGRKGGQSTSVSQENPTKPK